jgi:hypothetical protein
MSTKWTDAKDPSDESWYAFDAAGLLDGDTLAVGTTWTAPSGVTKLSEAYTSTVAKVKIGGGTAGLSYDFVLDMVTTNGQKFQRTCTLKVKQL